MIRVHQWTERAGWSGAAEMAAAQILIGIDPGNTGALMAIRRDVPDEIAFWQSWCTPEGLALAIAMLRRHVFPRRTRAVIIVEEPFFASSRSGAIEQGWAAGHVATLAAVAVDATDIVRAKSEVWQSPILGPALTETGAKPTRQKKGEPKVRGGKDKRSIRKRQALAILPAVVANSVTTKELKEALADAHGITRWGLLHVASE